jgi:excisionase family DNA binding protein
MSNDRQDVISTRQAAARLGVALRTVQLWVEQGSLQAWKTVGGHRRVFVESVERMLAERSALEEPSGEDDTALQLLVVEDDPHLRRLFELDVPSWVCRTELTLAVNGFEGLLKAGTHRPDVIITDLMMPGMDGFKMIEALRSDPTVTPWLIVVTALDAGSIRDRGGLPEDVRVLHKPARMAEIQAVVAEISRHLRAKSL